MRFDPAADPWGTAMLAAAALWVLSLLVLFAALLGRTSRRPGWIAMIVTQLAFLVAAVGGTWANIRQAAEREAEAPPDDALAKATVDSAGAAGGSEAGGDDGAGTSRTADGDPSTGGGEPATVGGVTAAAATGDASTREPATGDAATGDATTGEPEEAGATGEPDGAGGEAPAGDAGEAGGDEPEPGVAGEPTEPAARPEEPVVPEDLPKVEPLPDEPRAREVAIRDILEDAARAAGGGERCGNLERVSRAWARLRQVPVTRKAKSVAADLERCRRRLLYSVSQKRLREMIDARDAWVDELPGKLRKEHDLLVQASISGKSHERLRLGNRQLDAARADALMDAGLRDELVRLQFAHVVLSDGKKAKTYTLPVTPESELGLPWLRAVGLGEPLRLTE